MFSKDPLSPTAVTQLFEYLMHLDQLGSKHACALVRLLF
jgi:hypothetical protein